MNSVFPQEPLVFVDLETTGANFANDRIIEIGLVEVDQHGAREWSSLVNPGLPIPPFITHLTGIDGTMVESAPEFAELAPSVLEKLRGRLFIAHNARFDYNFLKREFLRLGINFRANSLCTVKLSRKLFPEHHRHSLETLVARFGIQVEERHRALADARVLWDLWQRWHVEKPADNVRLAVDAIVGRPQLPPQLDSDIIDDLPEAPGAYALFGETGELLKTKRAGNLRQQVLGHFSASNRDTALSRNTWRVDWREAAGEFGARIGELELSASTRKPFDDLCAWQLRKLGDGDFRPELVFARDRDFATSPELFGLYLSRREAGVALRKLVEANHLCHTLTGIGTGQPGEACVGFRQKSCRGACIGKETVSAHSARLMMAIARLKITRWPYAGPIALIERDEFGMREDFHVIDRWRHLGIVQSETALDDVLQENRESALASFDPEMYRLLAKAIKSGKLRILPLR